MYQSELNFLQVEKRHALFFMSDAAPQGSQPMMNNEFGNVPKGNPFYDDELDLK